MLFSLFLSWRSRCWDRFVIHSFCYAGSSSWNWPIYASVGKVLVFCCMGYNLMQPSRMLSCTHHHCMIGVNKFSELFLASLRSNKVSHIVTKWMNREVCIHILLSWGSYHWDRFAIYSLLLSWGPIAGTGC